MNQFDMRVMIAQRKRLEAEKEELINALKVVARNDYTLDDTSYCVFAETILEKFGVKIDD